MGLCENCKWWDIDYRKSCDRIDLLCPDEEVSSEDAGIRVHVDDDSGLSVRLYTGPYFGCTYFEERSQP